MHFFSTLSMTWAVKLKMQPYPISPPSLNSSKTCINQSGTQQPLRTWENAAGRNPHYKTKEINSPTRDPISNLFNLRNFIQTVSTKLENQTPKKKMKWLFLITRQEKKNLRLRTYVNHLNFICAPAYTCFPRSTILARKVLAVFPHCKIRS